MPNGQDLSCYGCVHDGYFDGTVSEDCRSCIRCYSGIEVLMLKGCWDNYVEVVDTRRNN